MGTVEENKLGKLILKVMLINFSAGLCTGAIITDIYTSLIGDIAPILYVLTLPFVIMVGYYNLVLFGKDIEEVKKCLKNTTKMQK